MSRYIDADKADVERISCFYGAECRLEDVQEWLDEQPTADVTEVVRCKECKKRNTYDCISAEYIDYHGFYSRTDDYDFCSYGERGK